MSSTEIAVRDADDTEVIDAEIVVDDAIEGEVIEPYVEYHSNNSGGSFWLTDDDWRALEAAGWKVDWVATSTSGRYSWNEPGAERYMGALATEARRYGVTLEQAIREFDSVTTQNSSDLGCSCCGTPHSFTLYDANGSYIDSWSPDYPTEGESYY
ncbi:hypothetical protein SEA_CAIB_70 [Gordonia phage CaiB]|nr:hypothetical protein SEA_CAIB_70 [Gordonia phage CaiB]